MVRGRAELESAEGEADLGDRDEGEEVGEEGDEDEEEWEEGEVREEEPEGEGEDEEREDGEEIGDETEGEEEEKDGEAETCVEETRAEEGSSPSICQRPKRLKPDESSADERRTLNNRTERLSTSRPTSLSALPHDVLMRIAREVVEGGEGCCAWELVLAAIALPCLRHALAEVEVFGFDDSCRCNNSSPSPSQRIRSFAWLLKQAPRPPHVILCLQLSPPPIMCFAVRSVLRPSLASLTTCDLYLSKFCPSPPRLLFSLSQAPRLESLQLVYLNLGGCRHGIAWQGCNDPVLVAEMWELVTAVEETPLGGKEPLEKNLGAKNLGEMELGENGAVFPALHTLVLTLPVCSPLVFRFISCLAPKLHSLELDTDEFAAEEGEEEEEELRGGRARGIDGDRNFSLHLPLATHVDFTVGCGVSLSAPLLSSISFHCAAPHSRLLLLPTCNPHLKSLCFQIHPSCPGGFHAPHLTALDHLNADILPEQAALLPPAVINSVKSLVWRNAQLHDFSAWGGLCCLDLGSATLSWLGSVAWPGRLEGLFVSRLAQDVVMLFKNALRESSGEGGGILGTSEREENGFARRGNETGTEAGGNMALAERGGPDEPMAHDAEEETARSFDIGKVIPCKSLQRFEGRDSLERVLYVWDSLEGLRCYNGKEGKGYSRNKRKFLKARGMPPYWY